MRLPFQMRCRVAVAVLLCLLLAATYAQAQAGAAPPPGSVADRIAGLLPDGTHTVDVMELVAPPRLEELAAKLQAAARDDPDWWMAYIKTAAPGEPLPYHPKLGLGPEEYAEFLALSKRLELRKVAEAPLVVSRSGAVIRLDSDSSLAELAGVEIDIARDELRTPHGRAAGHRLIEPSDAQSATGRWAGIGWKRTELDESAQNGSKVDLAVGRLEASGRGILIYEAGRIEAGRQTLRVLRLLTYDLPR